MVNRTTQCVARNPVADRGEVMKVLFLIFRNRVWAAQPQVRLKQQTSQDMTESLVREVSHVECIDHPVVEEIHFAIEKLVVRLELRRQQAHFSLDASHNRRPRLTQHSSKR